MVEVVRCSDFEAGYDLDFIDDLCFCYVLYLH